MPRKPKLWKWATGAYGCKVAVFERVPGGPLYIGVPQPGGGYKRESLGHIDKEQAKQEAAKLAAERQARSANERDAAAGPLTVAEMFRLYLQSCTGKHGRAHGRDVRRAAECWTRFLGAHFKVELFGRQEWDTFARVRGSGELDPRGNIVADPEKREPVRAKAVARDLKMLRAACGSALTERTPGGGYRLMADPTRKLQPPTEKNVRRPIYDGDRVDALMVVAPRVMMRVGHSRWLPSPLPLLLRLATDTGRRINAILHLRASDWRCDLGTYGRLRWRAENDKRRKEWWSPVTPEVRDALEGYRRDQGLVGEALLFPSVNDPAKPVSDSTASDWLARAEQLAGLEHLERGRWHPFRRAFATSRKHLPVKDVAAAGGWQSTATLLTCYQMPDDLTTEEVVLSPKRLRKMG